MYSASNCDQRKVEEEFGARSWLLPDQPIAGKILRFLKVDALFFRRLLYFYNKTKSGVIFNEVSLPMIKHLLWQKKHTVEFKWLLAIAFLLTFLQGQAQTNPIDVEPPFWWAHMKNPSLQLMVHAKDIAGTRATIDDPGIQLKQQIAVENPNYLFLNLEIDSQTQAGDFEIIFSSAGKKVASYTYVLMDRREGSAQRHGFDQSDVIYLLMPDRFANGNPDNDNMSGMLEKANRKNPDGRHGGDLKGIADRLGYFNELGVTALWLNPVLENNMPAYSYHGYAITDFYQVDPRLGSNSEYAELVKKAHQHELKVIMDMVFNHYGTGHKWTKDLPMADWVNQWPEFTRSNYRGGTITDPYAAGYDKEKMLKGWFDHSMADLNQTNEFVAKYLIQNSIWWIEYADLDGIRMDTYPYSDRDFMKHWMHAVKQEYPDFSVVGEVWLNSTPQVAYWQENTQGVFDSELNYVMDFPLKYAIGKAFNEDNGWSSGVAALYESLGLDFLFAHPDQIMTFLDNHDMDRIYNTFGGDINKLEMASTFLLTTRGVPQLQYGTEILMPGWEHDGHGKMRADFPGGWEHDAHNAFTAEGRSIEQNRFWNHLRLLLHWRKNNQVIVNGKLKHYIPEDGVYVYFRYTNDAAVMVILNNNNKEKTIRTDRFAENLDGYHTGSDILHRTYFETLDKISIPAMSARVIELN